MPNSHRPPDTTRQSCLCRVSGVPVWIGRSLWTCPDFFCRRQSWVVGNPIHTLTKRTRHRQDSSVVSGVAVQISCKARRTASLIINRQDPPNNKLILLACTPHWTTWFQSSYTFLPLDVCLSVCLSIRLSACLSITHRRCIETTKRNELVFWNVCFLPLILCVCYKEIRVSPKIRLHPAGTVVPNSALGNSPL